MQITYSNSDPCPLTPDPSAKTQLHYPHIQIPPRPFATANLLFLSPPNPCNSSNPQASLPRQCITNDICILTYNIRQCAPGAFFPALRPAQNRNPMKYNDLRKTTPPRNVQKQGKTRPKRAETCANLQKHAQILQKRVKNAAHPRPSPFPLSAFCFRLSPLFVRFPFSVTMPRL